MKTDKIDVVRDILATQANHWIFFPLVMFFANASGVWSLSFGDIAGFLVLGVVAVVMCFIMKQEVKFLVLMPVPVVAFILATSLFHFSSNAITICMIILVWVYFLYFLVKSLREVDPYMGAMPPYVGLLLFFILWVMMKAEHVVTNYFSNYIGFIVAIVFYLFAMYLENYQQFTYLNETTSASMPRQKLFRSGIFMSTSFITLGGLIMLTIALMSVSDSFLEKAFVWILKTIGRLFDKESGEVVEEEFEQGMMQMPDLPDEGSSPFWDMLGKLIIAIFILLFIIGIGYLLLALIKAIRDFRFPEYKRNAYKITLDDGTEDEYEKLEVKTMEKKERGGRLTIEQKIRRLYKRQVSETISDEEKRSRITAREFVKEQGINIVADVYEKARYSDEQCTREDLKNMQAVCRK